MSEAMRLGLVLLAAGRSERFGANKLLADYRGKPVVCCALEAMDAVPAAKKAVVTGCGEIAHLAEAHGFDVIVNDAPQLGQSHSIHLGTTAMRDMDAVLLLAADQPGLTGASLSALAEAFCAGRKGIACLRDETHMGNPAVFSARYYPALLSLAGDRGAKGILRANEEDLLIVNCLHPGELGDADTPEALDALRRCAQR